MRTESLPQAGLCRPGPFRRASGGPRTRRAAERPVDLRRSAPVTTRSDRAGEVNVRTPNIDRLADDGVRCSAALQPLSDLHALPGGPHDGQARQPLRRAAARGLPPPRDRDGRPPLPASRLPHLLRRQVAPGGREGGEHGLRGGLGRRGLLGAPVAAGRVRRLVRLQTSPTTTTRTFYSRGDRIEPHRLEGYQTDALTDLSLDYLRGYDDPEPWFHVISYEAPHPGSGGSPRVPLYPVPERFERMFDPADIRLRENVPDASAGVGPGSSSPGTIRSSRISTRTSAGCSSGSTRAGSRNGPWWSSSPITARWAEATRCATRRFPTRNRSGSRCCGDYPGVCRPARSTGSS